MTKSTTGIVVGIILAGITYLAVGLVPAIAWLLAWFVSDAVK